MSDELEVKAQDLRKDDVILQVRCRVAAEVRVDGEYVFIDVKDDEDGFALIPRTDGRWTGGFYTLTRLVGEMVGISRPEAGVEGS